MLFAQQRVKGTKNPKNKIVFCPTRMITGQVFYFISKACGANWIQGN
jgi:hypothetical protein